MSSSVGLPKLGGVRHVRFTIAPFLKPTFARFPAVSRQDRPFERVRQWQIALSAGKSRSKQAVGCTEALKRAAGHGGALRLVAAAVSILRRADGLMSLFAA